MPNTRTIVLYHANCPDGFGGAYSAWKKFGNAAEYLPLKHGKKPPEGLAGAHLFFIDFCYPKEIMDRLVSESASLSVLDHHLGIKDVVESMPEFVFDENRSGSTIAWSYFHPKTPVPTMLHYVEDGDLFRFTLPDSHAILSYIYTEPFAFDHWDTLVEKIENETSRAGLITQGRIYNTYHQHIVEKIAESAEMVTFEGHTCYLVSSARFFTSDVGHLLATKQPPLALLLSARADCIRVSMRGNGEVDVAVIARKYGGNGHPAAAAFSIPYHDTMPWQLADTTPPR